MRVRWLSIFAVAGVVASACVNPQGDFDNYADKTAPYRENGAKDAAAPDAAPPTEAVQGLYFGSCLSTLAFFRLDRVLRFYTQTTFTPDASGGGGHLVMKLTPLKLGPTVNGVSSPPTTVSQSETVGSTFTLDSPTTPQGSYSGSLGEVTVPGAANPISGRDIVIEGTALAGRFAKERFCGQLSGNVVKPVPVTLNGPENTCIFVPVKEGDPPPDIKLEDYQAGCAL